MEANPIERESHQLGVVVWHAARNWSVIIAVTMTAIDLNRSLLLINPNTSALNAATG